MIHKHSLAHLADDKTVLKNPHKGWYWHYFDNGIKRPMYRDKTEPGEDYRAFPGLNHLYLRIDWSDVQPTPDTFDWAEIDRVMDEWGAKGYTFSFRICCHESWPIQCFATPKWLYDMGCGGEFFIRGNTGGIITDEHGGGTWEPDYADPLFLKYLDLLLAEFARRFDGDSRVEYIDLGSYGIWGEGHTYFGSKKCFGIDVLKRHAILHAKHFKKTPIIVNDDFLTQLYGRPDSEKKEITDLCLSLGFGIRDDSVLVGSWDYKAYHNVEFPKLFKVFSENAPANIELAHFSHYTNDLAKGGLRIIEAARACRASFMGFHGYPDEWLNRYYYVTEYLANRLGYWYFIHAITHSDIVYAGTTVLVELEWGNAGFAPCYTRYDLEIKYTATTGEEFVYPQPSFDNRFFMENTKYNLRYFTQLSADMPEGKYNISLRLIEKPTKTVINLALKEQYKSFDGFYRLSEIYIKQPTIKIERSVNNDK